MQGNVTVFVGKFTDKELSDFKITIQLSKNPRDLKRQKNPKPPKCLITYTQIHQVFEKLQPD